MQYSNDPGMHPHSEKAKGFPSGPSPVRTTGRRAEKKKGGAASTRYLTHVFRPQESVRPHRLSPKKLKHSSDFMSSPKIVGSDHYKCRQRPWASNLVRSNFKNPESWQIDAPSPTTAATEQLWHLREKATLECLYKKFDAYMDRVSKQGSKPVQAGEGDGDSGHVRTPDPGPAVSPETDYPAEQNGNLSIQSDEEDVNDAAKKIQAIHRGRIVRQRIHKEREQAVTKIQAYHRGRTLRRELKEKSTENKLPAENKGTPPPVLTETTGPQRVGGSASKLSPRQMRSLKVEQLEKTIQMELEALREEQELEDGDGETGEVEHVGEMGGPDLAGEPVSPPTNGSAKESVAAKVVKDDRNSKTMSIPELLPVVDNSETAKTNPPKAEFDPYENRAYSRSEKIKILFQAADKDNNKHLDYNEMFWLHNISRKGQQPAFSYARWEEMCSELEIDPGIGATVQQFEKYALGARNVDTDFDVFVQGMRQEKENEKPNPVFGKIDLKENDHLEWKVSKGLGDKTVIIIEKVFAILVRNTRDEVNYTIPRTTFSTLLIGRQEEVNKCLADHPFLQNFFVSDAIEVALTKKYKGMNITLTPIMIDTLCKEAQAEAQSQYAVGKDFHFIDDDDHSEEKKRQEKNERRRERKEAKKRQKERKREKKRREKKSKKPKKKKHHRSAKKGEKVEKGETATTENQANDGESTPARQEKEQAAPEALEETLPKLRVQDSFDLRMEEELARLEQLAGSSVILEDGKAGETAEFITQDSFDAKMMEELQLLEQLANENGAAVQK